MARANEFTETSAVHHARKDHWTKCSEGRKIDAIGGTCHNGKIGVVGKTVSGLAKSDSRRNPEGEKNMNAEPETETHENDAGTLRDYCNSSIGESANIMCAHESGGVGSSANYLKGTEAGTLTTECSSANYLEAAECMSSPPALSPSSAWFGGNWWKCG